jgi:hypothetical protein
MSIAYAAGAGIVFKIREAFFPNRVSTKVILALLFCLVAHGLWVTMQSVLAWGGTTWGDYGHMVLQAMLISLYTAAVMPIAHYVLLKVQAVFINMPAGRPARYRR